MIDRFHGMMAHLPTVFGLDGEIDEQATRANIRRLLGNGIIAVYCMGSSGEFFNLSPAEYRRVVRLFIEEAGRDVLKIVGAGWPCLSETVETAAWLNGAGVDAILVMVPYLVPLNSVERVRCIREIASKCPALGVIHYNTSYAPRVRFIARDYASLLDVSNFWGAKHGTLNLQEWSEFRDLTPGLHHMPLDDWLVPTMKAGGHGAFSLLTSFSPRYALRFFEACESGNWNLAEAMEQEWKKFVDNVYLPLSRRGYSDIAVDKALIDCFGVLVAGSPRSPLMPVSFSDQRWAAKEIERERYFQNVH